MDKVLTFFISLPLFCSISRFDLSGSDKIWLKFHVSHLRFLFTVTEKTFSGDSLSYLYSRLLRCYFKNSKLLSFSLNSKWSLGLQTKGKDSVPTLQGDNNQLVPVNGSHPAAFHLCEIRLYLLCMQHMWLCLLWFARGMPPLHPWVTHLCGIWLIKGLNWILTKR